MNAIGIIREEAKEEARKEAREEKRNIAKVLKEQGIDYCVITLSTGLTKEEIDLL